MSNIDLHRQAIFLRKQGKSYSQIRAQLNISKSTLSNWLQKYPLTKQQIRLLRDGNQNRIEKFRQTMQKKHNVRLRSYYSDMSNRLLPLSDKELLLAGIALYWGEGGKTEKGLVSISNTDPKMLNFAILWLYKSLKIPLDRIQVLLHLYNDMDLEKETEYWSVMLRLPKSQFKKPYIKNSSRTSIDEKGHGHGTCNLRICNTVLKEKIIMSIKALADYSEDYLNKL